MVLFKIEKKSEWMKEKQTQKKQKYFKHFYFDLPLVSQSKPAYPSGH